jgi:hypothetical protein
MWWQKITDRNPNNWTAVLAFPLDRRQLHNWSILWSMPKQLQIWKILILHKVWLCKSSNLHQVIIQNMIWNKCINWFKHLRFHKWFQCPHYSFLTIVLFCSHNINVDAFHRTILLTPTCRPLPSVASDYLLHDFAFRFFYGKQTHCHADPIT